MEPSITRQCGNLSVTGAKRAWRRQYLIDKKCQIAFAGNMLLIAGVCMLVTALTMSWFFVYFMEDHLSGDIDTLYLIKLGIILLFMAVGIVIWTVIRTHAMAGPICKTRNILQAAARGEFPDHPVMFRRSDMFKELAVDLNRCLETMRADREYLERFRPHPDDGQYE
jgi:hypothetical protein